MPSNCFRIVRANVRWTFAIPSFFLVPDFSLVNFFWGLGCTLPLSFPSKPTDAQGHGQSKPNRQGRHWLIGRRHTRHLAWAPLSWRNRRTSTTTDRLDRHDMSETTTVRSEIRTDLKIVLDSITWWTRIQIGNSFWIYVRSVLVLLCMWWSKCHPKYRYRVWSINSFYNIETDTI